MIFSVSTVRDSPANVRQFVSRNLAAGVDHMFVFLDAPDAEVETFLAPHPHVTAIATGPRYWRGMRPGSLNVRQTINANRIRVLLAPFEWADWLFHIDGDECLDVDKDRLLALGRDVAVVQLATREAVSTADGSWDGYFKRLLPKEDLCLLNLLGLIDAPDNSRYFNGYVHGKCGIRPSLRYNLRIHRARTDDGEVVDPLEADFLHVLHYDSSSAEEFLRKWSTHVGGGSGTSFGAKKLHLRAAVESVASNRALTAERRRHYLLELYRRYVEDDAETLHELGFLVEAAPELHSYTPRRLAREQSGMLDVLLRHLVAADDAYFRPTHLDERPVDLLAEICARLPRRERQLTRALSACVAGYRSSPQATGR